MAPEIHLPDLHPILAGYIAWFKAHEKLLIIVLGAWLAFHFYGSALNAWVDHDKRLAIAAQQKVEADATANKQLEQQIAEMRLQLATVSAQAQANIQKRDKQNETQKEKNNQSTPSEVATRIIQLLRVQPQDVTASTIDGTLVFSPSAAHTDVNALEDGQTAQANVIDLTKQNAACTALVNKDEQLIVGLNMQLTDLDKQRVREVNEEKANSKKQFRRGFKYGYIAGIGTAIVVKIAKIF